MLTLSDFKQITIIGTIWIRLGATRSVKQIGKFINQLIPTGLIDFFNHSAKSGVVGDLFMKWC
jgi:hypothetical protein